MTDYRDHVYKQYTDRPRSTEVVGYKPCAIPDDFGNKLFADALAGVEPHAAVIELGAGEGHFLEFLQRRGFTNLRGVDLCEPLVVAAKQKGLDVTCANAFDVLAGIPDESVGAFVIIDMIEHLSKDEIIRLFSETHRCLNPGGVLLIQTVNGQGLFPGQVMYGDVTHCTILNPSSLGHLLTMAGFGEPEFRETVYFGPGKKAFLRKISWRLITWAANFCRWAEADKRQDVWSENMICWTKKRSS